jgi:hypothetical protein
VLLLVVVDLNLCSLCLKHERFLLLLDFTLVILNFLLILFEFQVLLLLQLLYLYVKVLLAIHISTQLILALQLLGYKCLEFISCV